MRQFAEIFNTEFDKDVNEQPSLWIARIIREMCRELDERFPVTQKPQD